VTSTSSLRSSKGSDHDEALERYRDADIVVDQLTPAGTASSRSSAWRSASRSSRSCTTRRVDAPRRRSAVESVVNASAETLHDRSPSSSLAGRPAARRSERASRAYVERVHDLDSVTDRCSSVYATVLEPAASAAPGAAPPRQRAVATCRRRRRSATTSSSGDAPGPARRR
jgi:hypothetical protein